MLTVALAGLVALAAFLVLAAWSIRRANPGWFVDEGTTLALRPLPDCEIGRQLQMAAASGEAGSGTPRGGTATAPSEGTTGAPGGDTGQVAPAPQPQQERRPPRRKKPSGPSRRAFLRNSMAVGWLGVLGAFGAASLAFLWPDLRGGFGARLDAGTEEEILDFIRTEREPFEFAPGRTYFVEYNPDLDPDGAYAELTNGAQVMALYWTCVHLGCKVPWCLSSQWLECGCHGSGYNRWGEYQEGPAPRGLDRFPVAIEDGQVVVDTGQLQTGPPRGTDVLGQDREGPSCI